MLTGILPWFAIVLVFGVLIFVHELGHFLAAKAVGVYAPRFSIGFGPALWSRKWGETEYVLAAVPLGGYVRMASRDDGSAAFLEGGGEHPAPVNPDDGGPLPRWYDPEALAPFGPKPVPPERLFESKPLVARLIIMLAGVTMNMLLGFVIIAGLAWSNGATIDRTRVIGQVRDVPGAPDLSAQLHVGDTIQAVDGQPVASWNDIANAIDSAPGRAVSISTQRGAVTIPLGPNGADRDSLLAAVAIYIPPVIGDVSPDMPAARAGIIAGDSVISVNGEPVTTWYDMASLIQRSPGKTIPFTVGRGGRVVQLNVRPDSAANPITTRQEVLIGVLPPDRGERVPVPFGAAVHMAWGETWVMAGLVVSALHHLATGALSVKSLSGPVGIGVASYTAARAGWDSILSLIALLSINLAVFNLLPVPILDGGQILVNVAESVKGSALSVRTRENLMRFGLATIALLFVIVMYNDLTNLVKHFLGL